MECENCSEDMQRSIWSAMTLNLCEAIVYLSIIGAYEQQCSRLYVDIVRWIRDEIYSFPLKLVGNFHENIKLY